MDKAQRDMIAGLNRFGADWVTPTSLEAKYRDMPRGVWAAVADLTAAIDELRHLQDPREAGSVANIRGRLESARASIKGE